MVLIDVITDLILKLAQILHTLLWTLNTVEI